MSALRVENVSKIFPAANKSAAVQALQNVSLDVNTNEFVSILGHSGCGKTTLLNLIAVFEKPSSGRIECAGKRARGRACNGIPRLRLVPLANCAR